MPAFAGLGRVLVDGVELEQPAEVRDDFETQLHAGAFKRRDVLDLRGDGREMTHRFSPFVDRLRSCGGSIRPDSISTSSGCRKICAASPNGSRCKVRLISSTA